MNERIGCIGSGPAAARLAAAQQAAGRLAGFLDLRERTDQPARSVGSIRAIAASSDILIVRIEEADAAREALLRHVFPVAPKGALIVCCSTMTVDAARGLAEAAVTMGVRFADAPLTDEVVLARAASTVYVGCEPGDFVLVSAALAPVAKDVRRVGTPGAGQAAEICRNLVLAAATMVVGEGAMLADRLDLAAEAFVDIAAEAAREGCQLAWRGRPRALRGEPAVSTDAMLTRLCQAQRAAARTGTALPVATSAQEIYGLFSRLGGGSKDFASVTGMLRGANDRTA